MIKTVSVIITTYNSENTIDRALNSIFNQEGIGSHFNLEVLVVDDCSSDRTLELVKRYNVHSLSTGKNSGGPNRGRNLGLMNATGDYICIVDHDDEWKSHKLVTQLPYLEKAPIVSCGYTAINYMTNKSVDRVQHTDQDAIYYGSNETFLSKLTKSLLGQNAYLGSIIYSSELKYIRFEENFGMVDFDWILRLFHGKDSIEISQSLYNRYVNGFNLSLNEEYRKKDFYLSLLQLEEYKADYPRETRLAYKRLHGSRARYYYLKGNMSQARFYFLRSAWNLKNLGYFLTTFIGSEYVKRKVNVFG